MSTSRKPLTRRLLCALVESDEPEHRTEIARVLGLDVEGGLIDLRSPLPSLADTVDTIDA